MSIPEDDQVTPKWWVQCNMLKPMINRQMKKRFHPEDAMRDRKQDLLEHMYECGKNWHDAYRLVVFIDGKKISVQVGFMGNLTQYLGQNGMDTIANMAGGALREAFSNPFNRPTDAQYDRWLKLWFKAYNEWKKTYDDMNSYIKLNPNGPFNLAQFEENQQKNPLKNGGRRRKNKTTKRKINKKNRTLRTKKTKTKKTIKYRK
jgi:hypothetical protein